MSYLIPVEDWPARRDEVLELTTMPGTFAERLAVIGGAKPRVPEIEHRRNLYAAILAQACNYGTTRMAELTGISVDTLDWTNQWYLREDTLRPANVDVCFAGSGVVFQAPEAGRSRTSSWSPDGLDLPYARLPAVRLAAPRFEVLPTAARRR